VKDEKFWRPSARAALAGLLIPVLLASAGPSAAAVGDCGQPVTNGTKPLTNDCLYTLRSAVGIVECELCVCDTDGGGTIAASDAQRCLRAAVGLSVTLSCPDCPSTTSTSVPGTSSTSTTTLPEPNPGCPGYAEWTTHAGFGLECESNADCAAGACDEETGRCRTETRWDVGWNGLGHEGDLNEGPVERLIVDCAEEMAPCGQCAIVGIDPSPGNCRCANDTRTICDQPLTGDFSDCRSCSGGANSGKPCDHDNDCPSGSCSGTAVCQCFTSPPIPASAGGTSFCYVPRYDSNVSGTVDVDSGSGEIRVDMRLATYIGIGTREPCPTCGGVCSNDSETFCVRDEDCAPGVCNDDPTPNDGVRDGVCSSYTGADSGKPCDKGAFHSTFPAFPSGPSGGWVSLDCMPGSGSNSSGQGLLIRSERTTATSSLPADLSCRGAGSDLDCPCLMCSNSPGVPCNSDEECAELSIPSTCTLATGSRAAECETNADCQSADAGNCIAFSTAQRCQYALSVECTTNAECQDIPLGTCPAPTCSSQGAAGDFPLPNGCENLECTDTGNEIGQCTTGPDSQYCAGVVRPNGEGILACATDDDCAPDVVGVDARPCSLVQRQPCFLDPIEADGNADPDHPVLAETYCVGTLSSAGKNAVYGLPGPARAVRQTSLRSYCDSNPEQLYSPGAGGCGP
jgi:hypothetical protein